MPRSVPIQKALGGTWRTTDGRDPATMVLRFLFLHTVGRLSPQCLEDLAGKVLPLFSAARTEPEPDVDPKTGARRRRAYDWQVWRFEDGDWDTPSTIGGPLLAELEAGLRKWSRTWRLNAPWILDAALVTLDWWDSGLAEGHFVGNGHFRRPGPEDGPSVSAWHPAFESWGDYLVRLERELRPYHVERERWAEEVGLKPPLRKDRRGMVHFEWLVKYQVDEWPYSKIGKKVKADPNTVRKAVIRLAGELGIELRPASRGGRPRSG